MNVSATYDTPESFAQSIIIKKEPNSSIISLCAKLLANANNPQPVTLNVQAGLLAFQIVVIPNHSQERLGWGFWAGDNFFSWSKLRGGDSGELFMVCCALRCHVIFCYWHIYISSNPRTPKSKYLYRVTLVRRIAYTKSQLKTSSSTLVHTRRQLQSPYLLTVLIS